MWSHSSYIIINTVILKKFVVNIKKKRLKKGLTKENEKSVCEKCGKAVWNIREHMNQHTPREARKKYKCKLCDKTFTALSGRNAHHRIKHLGLKKHCDICNKGKFFYYGQNIVLCEIDIPLFHDSYCI